MLTKVYQAEAKALKDGKPGEFEAVVAVFDNVDRQGDRVKSGAFDKTLEAWRKSGDPIPVVLAHQWDDVFAHIGVADPNNVKSIPGRGLYVKAQLDINDNPVAKQVYRLMERRSLKEFSFGYQVPPGGETKAKDGAYDLTEIDLNEFGPCLKGANPDTELLAVKSALVKSRMQEGVKLSLEERIDKLEELFATFEFKSVALAEEAEVAEAEPEDETEDSPGEGEQDPDVETPEGEVETPVEEPEVAKATAEDVEADAEPEAEQSAGDLDLLVYIQALDNTEASLGINGDGAVETGEYVRRLDRDLREATTGE